MSGIPVIPGSSTPIIHGSDLIQPAPPAPQKSFEVLVQKLDALQQRSDTAIEALATGQPVEIHRAILAVEEASLALRLALQVRNKAIEAYQEVMRMPL